MLTLRGVHAGYGRVEVLRGVDLTVPPGSLVALLGANGAGKTTLLKVIAGLLPTTAGTVQLRGHAIDRWSPARRARAGLCLVPEGRGIFRSLTVAENLAMHAGGRRDPRRLERVVDAFPVLGGRLDQIAGTLSGGEQQMLALSRSFGDHAEVVLADELSMGLAPVVVDLIFESLERLRAAGRSLLVVEQFAERVLPLADYAYVLHKGRIVFVGEPAQCRSDIFERYLGAAAGS